MFTFPVPGPFVHCVWAACGSDCTLYFKVICKCNCIGPEYQYIITLVRKLSFNNGPRYTLKWAQLILWSVPQWKRRTRTESHPLAMHWQEHCNSADTYRCSTPPYGPLYSNCTPHIKTSNCSSWFVGLRSAVAMPCPLITSDLLDKN